jgi:hypothetical protein
MSVVEGQLCSLMDRTLRSADSHEEVAEMDRADLSLLTFEERISAVEHLRRVWFGEDRTQPRLSRILTVTTLASRKVRARRRARRSRAW